jgi:hypothetical protein
MIYLCTDVGIKTHSKPALIFNLTVFVSCCNEELTATVTILGHVYVLHG